MGAYVKSTGPGQEAIRRARDFFLLNRVLVGIPGANAGSRGTVTNVELAFIHTYGSPRLRIPARPFLLPAIEQAQTQSQIERHMQAACVAAIEGDMGAAEAELEKAGIAGENATKNYMGSGNLAPNSKFTIEGGWMRNRISGKAFYAKPKTGSPLPLIDSGNLQNSVTHVMEKG